MIYYTEHQIEPKLQATILTSFADTRIQLHMHSNVNLEICQHIEAKLQILDAQMIQLICRIMRSICYVQKIMIAAILKLIIKFQY